MIELQIARPNSKQEMMLKARTKHVGFGGARGGGKSWAVRTKAKLLALRYPGIKILIVRRTYPELMNNHIEILRTELLGIAKYNDKDKVLRFQPGLGAGGCGNMAANDRRCGGTADGKVPSLHTEYADGKVPSLQGGRQGAGPAAGSTIHFMYCAKDGDLDRLQGQEYDIIFLDEATQLSEHQMKVIGACNRGVNNLPKRIYYTCNPGIYRGAIQ